MKDPATAAPEGELRRAGWIIAASYFALGLADPNAGLWQLPLQWLLKERLSLGAEEIAVFFATALLPWYFKPLAGLLSDALPLFGSRRRAYLLAGAGGAALASLAVAFAPVEKLWLLTCIITIHAALMLVSTVTGGLLVEAGQRWSATGRLTSWRSLAESTAALCAGPVGGWLAGTQLGLPAGLSVGLALSIFATFAINLRNEVPVVCVPRNARSVLLAPVTALLCSRGVWVAAALLCCYQVAPGFQTPLFFLQTDTLRFTPRFLGTLAFVSAVGSLAGAAAYAWCCRRIPFRQLFPAAIFVGVATTMTYLRYGSARAAVVIEACNGIAAAFAFVALLDLIARAMPKGQEALGYAFVFSVGNLASSASDIVGSRWFDAGVPFSQLVWVNAGTTALLLIAVPFIPQRLVERGEDSLNPHREPP
ncbi:MAG TPA: MFS transporter [Chthoniobacteraceae bacterium]